MDKEKFELAKRLFRFDKISDNYKDAFLKTAGLMGIFVDDVKEILFQCMDDMTTEMTQIGMKGFSLEELKEIDEILNNPIMKKFNNYLTEEKNKREFELLGKKYGDIFLEKTNKIILSKNNKMN